MWPAEHGAEILPAYLDWLRTIPDELTTGIRFLYLPPIPEVPEPLRGVPVIDVTGAFIGDAAEGAALLDPLRSLATPLIDGWAEMPASGLSRINGDPEQPTPGLTHYTVVGNLDAEAADAIIEVGGPESGTPLLMVGTRHLGGALASAPAGRGSARGGRGRARRHGRRPGDGARDGGRGQHGARPPLSPRWSPGRPGATT